MELKRAPSGVAPQGPGRRPDLDRNGARRYAPNELIQAGVDQLPQIPNQRITLCASRSPIAIQQAISQPSLVCTLPRLSNDEKHVVKAIIESILLSHEAKRWAVGRAPRGPHRDPAELPAAAPT